MITAVLNLNIGPGMLRRPAQGHFFVLMGVIDIYDSSVMQRLIPFLLCKICLQNVYDILFAVIANSQVYAVVHFNLFSSGLHITAHSHHNGMRVLLLGPVQHLSALPVGNIGYCTGIYDINVRSLIKWYNIVTLFL